MAHSFPGAQLPQPMFTGFLQGGQPFQQGSYVGQNVQGRVEAQFDCGMFISLNVGQQEYLGASMSLVLCPPFTWTRCVFGRVQNKMLGMSSPYFLHYCSCKLLCVLPVDVWGSPQLNNNCLEKALCMPGNMQMLCCYGWPSSSLHFCSHLKT